MKATSALEGSMPARNSVVMTETDEVQVGTLGQADWQP